MPDAEQWQLSGNAAEYYEKIAVQYMLGPWAPGLVDSANIQPNEDVLDIACGTGVVARTVAELLGPSGHVTGLDLNKGMLEVAKSLGNPGSGTMAWIQSSALDMDLPDGSFDIVLCQQGLQFFPDQHQALQETYRVMRPGGRVRFSVWAEAGPYNNAVAAALSGHIDEEMSRRYLATRDVPDAQSLTSMFSTAGFQQMTVTRVEREMRLPDFANFVIAHLQGTPVSGPVSALSKDGQSALTNDVARELSAYADGNAMVVPDYSNLIAGDKSLSE